MAEQVERAIQELCSGKPILVWNDIQELEADLTASPQTATPETIDFMITHGRGLLGIALPGWRLDQLAIPLFPAQFRDDDDVAFCVSTDLRGVNDPVSSLGRLRTIKALIDPNSKPQDFARPGHVFPLRSKGLDKRKGHTEAGIYICEVAGLYPAAILCEMCSNEHYGMADWDEVQNFAAKHNLVLTTVSALVDVSEKTY